MRPETIGVVNQHNSPFGPVCPNQGGFCTGADGDGADGDGADGDGADGD
ncbi:MAG: hypothetical protein R3E01_31070 [Pirellulaceae bacterium]